MFRIIEFCSQMSITQKDTEESCAEGSIGFEFVPEDLEVAPPNL